MLPLVLAFFLGTPPAPAVEPPRLSSQAFGRTVEIEVRDLSAEAARAAIQKAFAEIAEIERLTDATRPDGGLAVLNAASGRGPQPVDPRLMAVLARASDFCIWSEGAHGPLGRDLYALWGLRAPAAAEQPSAESIQQALQLASCGGLTLDAEKGTAALAPGTGLDLWGFAEGHAVDRAVEILKREGAGNGVVRLGSIERGFGPGPAGKGWPAALPRLPGLAEAAGEIYLLDRSLAVASQADHPRRSTEATAPAYLNQRTGSPPRGVLAAATVTDLAMDAQGLAAALLLTGPREGQLRLGSLRPRPSVLWFLGSGEGPPLQAGYRWSDVSRK